MTLKVLFQKVFRFICNHVLKDKTPITYVSGANDEYYDTLTNNLLDSIMKFEPLSDVIVWDLGLTPNQIADIRNRYSKVVIRQFDFESYPSHYKLCCQSYAWKSACIYETVKTSRTDTVYWLDAGCRLKGWGGVIRWLSRLYGFIRHFPEHQ